MKYLLTLVLALFASTALADVLPRVSRPVVNGSGTFNSSNVTKPMLIEFYYNGCGACNTNAAKVKAVAHEFADTVLTVDYSYDCRESEYTAWIRRHAPMSSHHLVVNGCDTAIFDDLNVNSFPTTILVDKDKNIVARYSGVWSRSVTAAIKRKLASIQ